MLFVVGSESSIVQNNCAPAVAEVRVTLTGLFVVAPLGEMTGADTERLNVALALWLATKPSLNALTVRVPLVARIKVGLYGVLLVVGSLSSSVPSTSNVPKNLTSVVALVRVMDTALFVVAPWGLIFG